LLFLLAPASGAQDETDGEAVYQSVCAACHQPNGRGISGVFPPLVGNANVDDVAYVEQVIRNGREGEIVVNGVTYNGVMPAQSQLSDAEIAAVVSFIQNELGAAPAAGEVVDEGPGFPWGLLTLFVAVSVLAIGIAYVAVTPGGATFTWGRAWWLAVIVFLYFAVGTVWLPDYVIQEPTLADAPELVRDVAASGAWFVALAVGIVALRWMQKKKRI
jgi:cytochrome c553